MGAFISSVWFTLVSVTTGLSDRMARPDYVALAHADPVSDLYRRHPRPSLATRSTRSGHTPSRPGACRSGTVGSHPPIGHRALPPTGRREPTYLPDLARGLWGFAWVRAAVGLELPEALAGAEDVIDIYQRLTEEIPEAIGDSLLSARYTLADVLDGLGRHDEAAELRRQIGGDAAPDDG